MDMKMVIERLNLFLKNNIKAFIIDRDNSYYFCYIKSINDVIVTIKNFDGKKAGTTEDILIADIKEIKLYKGNK